MKVGVCEADPNLSVGSEAWERMCEGTIRERPDLFLLNEMPFGEWVAAAPEYDEAAWHGALEAHEVGVQHLEELGVSVVAGSRAFELGGKRVNEAFVWTQDDGLEGVHTKQFFPDEEGYYEARWFEGGDRHFRVFDASGVRVGFLLCTELMFNEHARHYGRKGAQVILCPRAVGHASLGRWKVAMRMAAIVSGCYVLTSNRGGLNPAGQRFGGRGWIIDPEGEVVAQTSPSSPVAFYELDLERVEHAQSEYPCYVKE